MLRRFFCKVTISAEQEAHEPSDLLWRAIDWHRSGRRGESQKLAYLRQGLLEGKLSNNYPWILDDQYIASSRASVKFEVLASDPNQVWESSSEEEEEPSDRRVKAKTGVPTRLEPKGSIAREIIVKSQEPKAISISSYPKEPFFPPPIRQSESATSSSATVPKESPAKATVPRPVPAKAAPAVSPLASSSSSATSIPAKVKSSPSVPSGLKPPPAKAPLGVAKSPLTLQTSKPAGSKSKALVSKSPSTLQTSKPAGSKSKALVSKQPLRPFVKLPDTVDFYTWTNQGRLVNTSTRDFRGSAGLCVPTREGGLQTLRAENVYVLALDWYQTISRSKTASAEAINRIPDENVQLIRNLKRRFKGRILICVVSYISRSVKNLQSLLEACQNTEGLQDLIPAVFITRDKCGTCGKKETIKAITQRASPAGIVDDNNLVINECFKGDIFTVHLKLRRKPWCDVDTKVCGFLEETEAHIVEDVVRHFPDLRDR